MDDDKLVDLILEFEDKFFECEGTNSGIVPFLSKKNYILEYKFKNKGCHIKEMS